MSTKLFFLIGCVFLAGCSEENQSSTQPTAVVENNTEMGSDSVHVSDIVSWYHSDNGNQFQSIISTKNFQYKLSHRPGAYFAALELDGESVDQAEWDSILVQYSSLIYFELEILSSKGGNDIIAVASADKSEYEKNVSYLNFHFGDGIFINSELENLPAVICQMEQTIGARPGIKFLIAFENKLKVKDFTVSVNDPVFSGHTIEFEFAKNTLINEPIIFL